LPPPSPAVVAAEAEIAATRQRLDATLAGIRRELAPPIAAALGAASLLSRAEDAKRFGDFVRRNAVPLGLIALGADGLASTTGARWENSPRATRTISSSASATSAAAPP
jgi:hypothetical protein